MKPPKPPKDDYVVQSILDVFYMACRGRRYAGEQPLSLSVADITDIVTAHPVPIPRNVLDDIIFALDDLMMEKKDK